MLNAKIPAWRKEYPFLWSAVSYLKRQQADVREKTWPLHVVWNGIDENYKLAGIVENVDFEWPPHVPSGKKLYRHYQNRSWGSFWLLAGWELKRTLANIYGTRLKGPLRNPALRTKWLAAQLLELEGGDVVASTNYDLLVETIIQQKWPSACNCRTEKEYRLRTTAQGPLILKLHGSLDWLFRSSWITNRSLVDRTPDGAPIPDNDIDLDPDFWETRPLVIAPVRYKDEIVFPRAQPPELVEVLNFQWRGFIDAVSKADELSVFGYRFPEDDSYGNRLLQEAIRRRRANARLRVQLYLPKPECQKVRKRLEEDIFVRGKAHIECRGAIP